MEKNFHYQKKIIGYLDGSLSQDDRSEFEAFVRSNPEFQSKINEKEQELMSLRSLIPSATLSRDAQETLEEEMKLSVLNLLKVEPKNLLDSVKTSWEDWLNR